MQYDMHFPACKGLLYGLTIPKHCKFGILVIWFDICKD